MTTRNNDISNTMKSKMNRKPDTKRLKRRLISKRPTYDEVEEKQNNAYILRGLKAWEKKYLRLIQWSYVHRGRHPRVKGCLNLLEPLRCEEMLVSIDWNDVEAVLKIMGHNWPTNQKRRNQKKKVGTKKSSTKGLDELMDSVSREEDELVKWWKRPYCTENVQKYINQNTEQTTTPLFFKTYDEEERLWGFAERMSSAASSRFSRSVKDTLTAGSKRSGRRKRKLKIQQKRKSLQKN